MGFTSQLGIVVAGDAGVGASIWKSQPVERVETSGSLLGCRVAECLHGRVALCAPSKDARVAAGCSVSGCRYMAEHLHQRVALYVSLEDE